MDFWFPYALAEKKKKKKKREEDKAFHLILLPMILWPASILKNCNQHRKSLVARSRIWKVMVLKIFAKNPFCFFHILQVQFSKELWERLEWGGEQGDVKSQWFATQRIRSALHYIHRSCSRYLALLVEHTYDLCRWGTCWYMYSDRLPYKHWPSVGHMSSVGCWHRSRCHSTPSPTYKPSSLSCILVEILPHYFSAMLWTQPQDPAQCELH